MIQVSQNSVSLILFFSLIMPISIYSESDTTYSQTRIIPKYTYQTDDNPPKAEKHRNNNSDADTNSIENLIGKAFGQVIGEIVFEPFKVFFSNKYSSSWISEKPIKIGVGISLFNFSYYPQIALNYGFKFNGELFYPLNDMFAVRENIGAEIFFANKIFSDFERDVFVNGNIIGNQKDICKSYKNFSFPINSELLYKPFKNNGSHYFIFGGGPRYVNENMYVNRQLSYQNRIDNLSIKKDGWIPSVSIGVGQLIEIGTGYGLFEIKYSIGINDNLKILSLPSMNSPYVNSIALMQCEFML
jgi:hypothetical protein